LPNFHSFFAPQLLQNILIIRINLLNRLILTYQGANFYILPHYISHKKLSGVAIVSRTRDRISVEILMLE